MFDVNPEFGRYSLDVISNEGILSIEGNLLRKGWPNVRLMLGLFVAAMVVVLASVVIDRIWNMLSHRVRR